MSIAKQKSPREFTGRHMWLLALSFFGVIIAVNAVMATMAIRSWTGLAVDNSYVASQQFEEKRLAHQEQLAAGWRATLTYLPGAARLVIIDGADRPVDIGDVSVKFNRPVGGHDDQLLELKRNGTGAYEATVDLPLGVWEATVTAPDTTLGPFELRERFRVEDAK